MRILLWYWGRRGGRRPVHSLPGARAGGMPGHGACPVAGGSQRPAAGRARPRRAGGRRADLPRAGRGGPRPGAPAGAQAEAGEAGRGNAGGGGGLGDEPRLDALRGAAPCRRPASPSSASCTTPSRIPAIPRSGGTGGLRQELNAAARRRGLLGQRGARGGRAAARPAASCACRSARTYRRRGTGRPPATTDFLFFGRVRAYKGLDLLRDAFAALRERHPGATLRVVGEGDVEGCAPGLSALPGVTVEPRWVPDGEMPALLSAARAVVLPYREASQSGVLPLAPGARRAGGRDAGGRALRAARARGERAGGPRGLRPRPGRGHGGDRSTPRGAAPFRPGPARRGRG